MNGIKPNHPARTKPSFGLRVQDAICVFALVIICVIIWLPRLSGPLDLRWDAAAYYTLGTSLAQGHGYRLLNEPGAIQAIQYPPLLPALIAAYQLILNTDDPDIVSHYLRLTYALAFASYIVSIYFVFKRYLPDAYSFLATLISAVNPTLIVISDFCLADLPFALIVSLFFLCSQLHRRPLRTVLAPALAVAAYTMRTAGLALLAAWVAEALLNRNPKQALSRLLVALLPVLCWQVYIHQVEQGLEYANPAYAYQRADYMYYNVSYARNISLVDPFVPAKGHVHPLSLAQRYVYNVMLMPKTLGGTVSARLDFWRRPFASLNSSWGRAVRALTWLIFLVPYCLGGLIIAGICLQLVRRQWLIPTYVLSSLAMICSTPFVDMFTRYMIPVAPYVSLALFISILELSRQAGNWWPGKRMVVASALTALVSACCLLQSPFSLRELYGKYHEQVSYVNRYGRAVSYRLFYYDESCRALDAGIDWLRSAALPRAVIAASMPHWVYLRTGIRTVMPPFEPDPVEVQRLLDSVPVTYAILDGTLHGKPADTSQYVSPAVRHSADSWRLLYSDQKGDLMIFQR